METPTPAVWDKAKDLLTILIIPTLLWVFNVSSSIDNLDRTQERLQKNVIDLHVQQKNTDISMARLETRLTHLQQKTDEIYVLLREVLKNEKSK